VLVARFYGWMIEDLPWWYFVYDIHFDSSSDTFVHTKFPLFSVSYLDSIPSHPSRHSSSSMFAV